MKKPAGPGRERLSHPALFEDRRAEWMKEKSIPFQKRAYFVQLAIFGALLVVWQFPVLNPVKLLVVLFHEMSHVAAAYVTGGLVFGIAIDPGGAGVTLGMGGNRLLVLAAGYVGSLVVGVSLYGLSAVWKASQVWIALTLLSCTSLTMGWLNSFTKVFGSGTLFVMIVSVFILNEATKRILIRIVGTACCLYPVIDVLGELVGKGFDGFTIRGQLIGSDVLELSRLTGVPWGVLALGWSVAGLGLLAYLVTWTAKLEAMTEVKRELYWRKRKLDFRRARVYNPNDPTTIPEYTIK